MADPARKNDQFRFFGPCIKVKGAGLKLVLNQIEFLMGIRVKSAGCYKTGLNRKLGGTFANSDATQCHGCTGMADTGRQPHNDGKPHLLRKIKGPDQNVFGLLGSCRFQQGDVGRRSQIT